MRSITNYIMAATGLPAVAQYAIVGVIVSIVVVFAVFGETVPETLPTE
jgi:hypothetical protein